MRLVATSWPAMAVLFAACHSSPDTGDVTADRAGRWLDAVVALRSAVDATDGSMAVTELQDAMYYGQAVVLPHGQPRPILGLFGGGNGEENTGVAICDANGCTYSSFMGGIPLTESFTLDGTIAKSGNTLTFDLTYSFNGKGGSGHWTIDGAVTAGPTNVDGALHGHGHAGGGSYDSDVDVTWDVVVEPANVELDATGCPIGGSIHATASYHDRGNGIPTNTSPSYDVQGGIGFGPSCGDAH